MLDEKQTACRLLVMFPSRELAAQIYQAALQLASFSEKRPGINYVGGTDKVIRLGS